MSTIATYKGKKYRCLYLGETRYGRRAHLQFFSGAKSFWVDASAVAIAVTGPQRQPVAAGPRDPGEDQADQWAQSQDYSADVPF